jgi:hypothetical protein
MKSEESFLGIKQPRREANHSPIVSAEFQNGGVIVPLPHTFMAYCLNNCVQIKIYLPF